MIVVPGSIPNMMRSFDNLVFDIRFTVQSFVTLPE